MNLISWVVTQFVAVFFIVVRYIFKPTRRHGLMTAGAVLFILLQNPPHILLRIGFILVTFIMLLGGWLFGRVLAQSSRLGQRAVLTGGIAFLLTPLVLFKLVQTIVPTRFIDMFLAQRGNIDLGSLAPLGISYFTFRAMAYLIEIWKGKIQPVGWWRYWNYVAFWPTLMAGPIERPGAFLQQTATAEQITSEDIREGFLRIISGLGKKLVLGSFFYQIAKPYLMMEGAGRVVAVTDWPTLQLWVCVHAYYLYLYCDFAGYSDIAIGISRLFGYRIMENFRWPILATNVADFWRRWHISLTGWITDYVYYPMGGNKKGMTQAAKNTALAMLLVGIWHGISLHFALWGLYHAAFLILYRQYRKRWRKKDIPNTWWRTGLAWLITFEIVNLGWVLFVFKLKLALQIYARLFFIV